MCNDTPLYFIDWNPKPKGDHRDFYNQQKKRNLLIDIITGAKTEFNEYDKEMIAEMIKQDYLHDMKPTFPVFTGDQWNSFIALIDPFIDEVQPIVQEILNVSVKVMRNHTPQHLSPQVEDIAYNAGFKNLTGDILQILINNGKITSEWDAVELPGLYAVI